MCTHPPHSLWHTPGQLGRLVRGVMDSLRRIERDARRVAQAACSGIRARACEPMTNAMNPARAPVAGRGDPARIPYVDAPQREAVNTKRPLRAPLRVEP